MSTAEEQNESEYSNRVLYEGSESGSESKAGQRRAKGRAGNPWLPTSIVEAFLPSRALSCPLPHHTRLSRHVSHPRQCTQTSNNPFDIYPFGKPRGVTIPACHDAQEITA